MCALRTSTPSSTALALGCVLACVLACAAAAPACATAPPPDFLNGPAYSGRDTWSSPNPAPAPLPDEATSVGTTRTTSAAAGGAAGSQTSRTRSGASAADAELVSRRVLVRSVVHVLASDGANVYYGDDAENALMAVSPEGGTPVLVGRPAPLDVTLDGSSVAWITRPGNTVVRVARPGSVGAAIGVPGNFTALAADGRDIFVSESVATGCALTLMSGTSAQRLATMEAPPRGVKVDATNAYVVTSAEVVRIPRAGGPAVSLASGRDFAEVSIDRDHVYATVAKDPGRAVVRVPKAGGPLVEIVGLVRPGPVVVAAGEIYFLDPDRPELMRVAVGGGAPERVVEDQAFARVTALAVDDRRAYVATERAGLVAFALPARVNAKTSANTSAQPTLESHARSNARESARTP